MTDRALHYNIMYIQRLKDGIYDTVIMRARRQDILRASIKILLLLYMLMPLATVPLGTETASAAPLFRDSFQLTNWPISLARNERKRWCSCQ